MHGLFRDVRFGLRLLRRNPGFTLVAVITLALGIGANTAIFSVVHAVLLRPLPFPEPERLLQIMESREQLGWDQIPFTHANFWDVAAGSSSFSEIGAWTGTSLTLTGTDRPRRLAGRNVSPGFFKALGISPVHGRLFDHGDESPGSDNRLAVLSYSLWRSTFGGNPEIVDRSITLDGESFRVVGVAPPGEPFLNDADVFLPMVHRPDADRVSFELFVAGRLAPAASEASALAELAILAEYLERRHPEECIGIGFTTAPSRTWVAGDGLRLALWVLLGTTGFLLLIACVNLANMWLAKVIDRTRETALRAALGAGRGRIIQQMLTESLVLCFAGASIGVVVAYGLVSSLRSIGPDSIPRLDTVSVNPWVLTFTCGITVATGLLSGLLPAIQLRRMELASSLRAGDRTSVGSRSWTVLRNVLVAAEVAISLVLLIGAGLLTRSFLALLQVERGLETENRLAASVNLPSSYDSERTRAFFEHFLARTNNLPKVRSAAAVNFRPLLGASSGMGIATPENPGVPGETVRWATWRMVTPGYFSTLGLEIRQGRDFDQDIIANPWRVVISESLANALWTSGDAIGRTATLWRGQNEIPAEVIGVVEDMRERGLAQDPTLAVYMPYFGVSGWPPEIIIQAETNPLEMVPTIRTILAEIDPELPLDDVATLDEIVSTSVTDRRLNMSLMGLFAGVALLLALAGVYGVQAYAIARRAPEIGLRVVLGARRGAILTMVLRQSMRAAIIGAGLGAVVSFWLSRTLVGLLFGVTPTDVTTYAIAIGLLLATTLISCYLPARRALSVDPAEVLRAS